MEMGPGEDRCRWFARSLVEGSVVRKMRKFKPACQPSLITLKVRVRLCVVFVCMLGPERCEACECVRACVCFRFPAPLLATRLACVTV